MGSGLDSNWCTIGARYVYQYVKARLAHYAVWDTALAPAEIAALAEV